MGDGRNFALFPILRRYVKRLSPAQKRSTWKKVGRKLPGLRPGAIRQKRPGDVVVLVDVSGSMEPFLDGQFPATLGAIYAALQRLARVYGNPSGLAVGSVAAEHTLLREIRTVEELTGLRLPCGGATHYGAALDVLLRWNDPPTEAPGVVVERAATARRRQPRPDLVLFVTDLDHDVNTYLADPKYRALDDCLVWLVWKHGCTVDVKPCRGEVVALRPDDWGARRR
ncbi:MAG: VWA domain-containing protein [Deltaproteobacteria bacterium]|nr:VWA domain-containing protein [Deltaproteobacteria bacterium]